MKFTNQQLREEFESMEAANEHGAALLLLAVKLGDEKDVFVISRICEIHEKMGYLPGTLNQFRNQIAAPLYAKLKKLD